MDLERLRRNKQASGGVTCQGLLTFAHIKSKKKAISERYNTKTALISLLQTHFRGQFVTCPSSKILGYGMSKIGGSLS